MTIRGRRSRKIDLLRMKRPYITLKFAQTLDGRIAAKDGSSKWISGPKARKFAHGLRAKNDAILVGAKTILKDNPSLTTRFVKGKSPARIIIDGKLSIPLNSSVVKTANRIRTIVVTSKSSPRKKMEQLKKRGVDLIALSTSGGSDIDLRRIIRILSKKGIKSILVEGGSEILTSFIRLKLADNIIVIISPKFSGKGIESIGDLDIKNIKKALSLKLNKIKRLGDDIVYNARIGKK